MVLVQVLIELIIRPEIERLSRRHHLAGLRIIGGVDDLMPVLQISEPLDRLHYSLCGLIRTVLSEEEPVHTS